MFESLTEAFVDLMDMAASTKLKYDKEGRPYRPAVLSFWCKAGKHRSYALLVFFLMYAAHVHDPDLVEALLWTRLRVMRPDADMVKGSQIRARRSRCSKMTGHVFAAIWLLSGPTF